MTKLRISQWAREDRPRERLIHSGVESLSNAELLAIIIGSGNAHYNAVDLARNILKQANHDLNELAAMDYGDLIKFCGIGPARAVTIVSALELSRRRSNQKYRTKQKIAGSKDIYLFMESQLLDKKVESFWAVYLNRAHAVLHRQMISQGGVSGTVVDPKLVFKFALEQLASALVLVHNHPSGQLKPSRADLSLTKKLVEAGHTLEIPVLDHIIFTNSGYFSFADEALL